MDRPIVSQPLYNIVDRLAEVEQLPAAGHYGIGVAPYSPLARGVLSGKYDPGAPPPEGLARGAQRHAHHADRMARRNRSRSRARWPSARRQSGCRTVAFAIAWVMRNRFVTAPIVGPRTEEQWDAYLPALDAVLDAEDEAFVDGLVPPGHASTPGYTDPAYPIEGRQLR